VVRLYYPRILNILIFINSFRKRIINLFLSFFRSVLRVRFNLISSCYRPKRFHGIHRHRRMGSRSIIKLSNIYLWSKESTRAISTLSESKPVLTYINPDQDKRLIIKQNKGKSGIYR
jgi:hypothetical protein